MRRVVSIVFLTVLVVAAVAPPGAAKKVDVPDGPIAMAGITTYGAIEARTGDYAGDAGFLPGWEQFMDPAWNRCLIVEATLEMTGTHTGVLTTVEQCLAAAIIEPPRAPVTWDVHISSAGILKMEPRFDMPDVRPMVTGCGMNGTYPVHHGWFDGSHLYAATEFHGICDGGLFWGEFGIDAADGPLHATFEVILDVVSG